MTRKIATAALIASLAAPAAMADIVTLETPVAGATLHSDDVDMSVYYTENADQAFEVVAFYTDSDAPQQPARLVMALSDGDSVRFGLPGYTGTLYEFSRNGDRVTVSDMPVGNSQKRLY